MAMVLDEEDHPFFVIVANCKKPEWAETAIAYATFYHLVSKGEYIHDAVLAMRAASGNENFLVDTHDEVRQSFFEHIHRLDVEEAQEKLEQVASAENPGHLAKLRRVEQESSP